MQRPLRVVLGDVVHRSGSALSPSTVPFQVARIAAYAMQRFGAAVEIELFKDPFELIDRLRRGPADVLALSHYFWNAELSAALIRFARTLHPAIVTVQGGPNLDRDPAAYRALARRLPELDFHVVGEGETSFAALVERLLAEFPNVDRVKADAPGGCFAVVDGGRDVVVGPELPRLKLEEMPSPYLMGLLDPFLAAGLEPIVETVRGCPYSCAFCEQGSEFFRKITSVELERAKAEIEYIRARVRNDTLIIADVNFGILPRDKQLAEWLRQQHADGGFPRQIYVYTAKNPNRRTLEVIETLYPMTPFYASFQSTDEGVLRNINRSNIGYDKYLAVTTWAKQQGIPIGTELIFGLPGESLKSFVGGVAKLMRLNSDYLAMYNLRLFAGIELNTPEKRAEFGMRTMFRPMDTNYGEYPLAKVERIIECEEIVVGSKAFDFADFLTARRIGFLTELLWNSGYVRPLLAFLQARGLSPVEVFSELLRRLPTAPAAVQQFFADYDVDVRRELFDSDEQLRAECISDDSWTKIQSGGRFFKINFGYAGKAFVFGVDGLDEWIFALCVELAASIAATPADQAALGELERYSQLLRIRPGEDDPAPHAFRFDILGWTRAAYADELTARTGAESFVYAFRNPDADGHRRFQQRYNTINGGWSQLHVGERFMMEMAATKLLRRVEPQSDPQLAATAVALSREWGDTRQATRR